MVQNTRYPLTDAVECTVDEYRLRRDGLVCFGTLSGLKYKAINANLRLDAANAVEFQMAREYQSRDLPSSCELGRQVYKFVYDSARFEAGHDLEEQQRLYNFIHAAGECRHFQEVE